MGTRIIDSQSKRGPSKEVVSFTKTFLAGGLAGTIGATILCPLEVVKTRLQSSLHKQSASVASKNQFETIPNHIKGVFQSLISIQREEGFRALWKGLTPNLIGIVPARSIYFSCYGKGKDFYTKLNGNVESSIVHMASAATAGTCTALITNPIWLVKTRMQLQSEKALKNPKLPRYHNSFHCFQTVLRTEGLSGLYSGFSASLLGLTESTMQFVMYEYFKRSILQDKQLSLSRRGNEPERIQMTWFETTASASVAKLVAAITTYPHEVIRTRLRQTPEDGIRKYTGLLQSAKLIYAQEGIAALYGGKE